MLGGFAVELAYVIFLEIRKNQESQYVKSRTMIMSGHVSEIKYCTGWSA